MTQTRLQLMTRVAWIIGVLAGLVLAAGAIAERQHFLQAWLYAWLFWLGLSLGSLALGMLAQLTGGRWAMLVRRPAAAAAGTLPLLAVLFAPVLFGLHQLYPWASGAGAPQHLLSHKEPYLNEAFFVTRAVVYFAIWIALALGFSAWLREAEYSDAPRDWQKLRQLSAGGLLLYAITGTLAAVDWLMSLMPAWYSTVFGAQVLAVQMLAASAVVVLCVGLKPPPVSTQQGPGDWNDLGNLMLMFTLLWAYLAYSDFLTIWIADLPHETEWYRQRSAAPWQALGVAVWVLQFALPFALLLFRAIKRHAGRLRMLALMVLAGSLLNVYWLVMPSLRRAGEFLNWLDWIAPLALGGIWMAVFLIQLDRHERKPRSMAGEQVHAGN